jgi:D-3-phosphoglycerate dehydrogenase
MTNRKTVLITDKFSDLALQTLNGQDSLFVRRSASPDLSRENLDAVHALIIRSRTKVDKAIFKRAKDLQVIITCTSGFDHIDLTAANEWGVTVMFTPAANIESAAQLTWSLLLASVTRLHQARSLMTSGHWEREKVVGLELAGKTLGVIGLGRIGTRVSQLAKAFHMQVIAHDPFITKTTFKAAEVERLALPELLARADVISLHVPLTKETKGMMGAAEFAQMRRAILINCSRGPVVQEQALLAALNAGQVQAAGLDVFEKEPLPATSELLTHERVTLSPHIGANTQEAFEKASDMAAEKLVRFFVEGTTSDTLPPKASWYTAQN